MFTIAWLSVRSIRRSGIYSRSSLVNRYRLGCTLNYSVATSKIKRETPDAGTSTLEVIRNNVATRERLRYEALNEYVESLNEPITTENISFLYDCISRYLPQVAYQQKAELIGKLWAKVKLWKSPAQDDYVSWMRALGDCEADIVLDHLQSELNCIEPTMKLYEELLYLVSSHGQPGEAVEILDRIKQQEFPLTETIFNALIVAHSRDKNLEAVESVLELMTAASLTPNNETQFEMARAYINNDLAENSKEIIDLAEFSTRQLLELLKTVLRQTASSSTEDWIHKLVQKLPGEVQRHRDISPIIKNFMIEQIHIHNRPKDVLRMLKCLPTPAIHADNDDIYGAFLLNELFETNQPFAVIKSFCDFLVSEGRNPRAVFVATEMSLRRHSPQSMDFLRFLATVEPLKPHYFWPLFIEGYQMNGEQGVIDLIVEMKSLSVQVDSDTINIYIIPRIPLILKNIIKGIQLITDSGMKMAELAGPLLLHLLATERFDDFHLVLNTYPSQVVGEQFLVPLVKNVHPKSVPKDILKVLKTLLDHTKLPTNTDINGSFIVEMANVGKFVPLQGFISEIVKHRIKISQTAKSRAEERIRTSKSLTPELQTHLLESLSKIDLDGSVPLPGVAYLESKHPKDMSYNELESHLAELEGKQLNTRGVLRKLLQLAVKEKRYEKALQLKVKCDELAMNFSPGMLASCIELYTKSDLINDAQQVWAELEEKFPEFVIDEHKAIDFATFLIKHDMVERAKEILLKRAKRNVIGENNNKNVWHLLNALAEQGTNKQANHSIKAFLDFLVKLKYCRHTNTLLGPLVRERLLKKDLRGAVSEYKDILKRHRKTPLNLELMTILVSIKNGQNDGYGEFTETEVMEMIGDVFKAVEHVHGLAPAKTSLLFATAEGGTDKQVRKILMDPSVRVDPQALQRQCEYLGKSGKTEPLLRLIKSSRGLPHSVINEQQLWCVLMQTLAKQNHIDEAVRLFDQLLEEDEFKVNKEIAEIVIDLLKRNNLELPPRLQTFDV